MSAVGATQMLRLAMKLLLIIEVVVCFAPAATLLLLGAVMIPFQLAAMNAEPQAWEGAATIIGSVLCGVVGLLTLLFVLTRLLLGHRSLGPPALICTGVALGALPLVPYAVLGDPLGWSLVGVLPLAASAHILFLGRKALFPSWRDALRSAGIATTVALLLPAALWLDPFRASSRTIRDQRALWEQVAPDDYEFTVRLSGWVAPEALIPKRISVEDGEVVSASYAWDSPGGHKAGDPAPMEDLWTIDRVFAELLAAEERGWRVGGKFDERWGFVEKAYAEEPSAGWDLEIRDFVTTSVTSERE